MDKNREILELKKLYLVQIEKWESRTFFVIFSFFISLILLSFKYNLSYWWGLGGLLFIGFLESLFQNWRTRKFNELKREIETGKFKSMELKPERIKD